MNGRPLDPEPSNPNPRTFEPEPSNLRTRAPANPRPSFFIHNLLVFSRLLRHGGLDVHTGRVLDLVDALSHIDLKRRDEVYHTCRSLLTHRREDITTFDRIFAAFWRDQSAVLQAQTPSAALRPRAADAAQSMMLIEQDADAGQEDDGRGNEDERELPSWSDTARLAHKDFAEFTPEELVAADVALSRLAWTPGYRRTRRWVAGRGPKVDVRLAIARSLRTGGDIVRLPRERRRVQPRPLVILCDVSGSMELYSRILLHFAHGLARQRTRVEIFLFSTRLTRITADLRRRGVDEAMARVSRSMQEWSGGTRIGDALRQLNQQWSRRVLVRAPIVLLISDGWDRGEPAVIRDEMARLQRSCHRLIWLNPLIGTQDYAPLTRGLQAALPFVDDFLPVRTLTNVADLAVHLDALAHRRH